jgi:hypothetical protein
VKGVRDELSGAEPSGDFLQEIPTMRKPSDMDDSTNSKVTVTDAGEAKHGYADESDIAKRNFDVDTPEANENPVSEKPGRPGEKPTTKLGAHVEDQEELLMELQADEDEQEFETADETVEMRGSNEATFQATRDASIRWESPEHLDRGEYDLKTDAEVAMSLGIDGLPVADQSGREPIPELVDRRSGESLAMYEKRVGEEADHERMRQLALSFVETTDEVATDQSASVEEHSDMDAEYVSAWMDEHSESDSGADGAFDATRQRAESSRTTAAATADIPAKPPEADADIAGALSRDQMDFDERAKLAAGLEPDAAWSPKKRIGEEILELGQYVEKVAEKAHISDGQALILLCEMRLETPSAQKAAMRAVERAPSYFKDAPEPVTDISPRRNTATVEGVVDHLFTPWNANEHQVALIEDVRSGEKFRFYIHTNARFSKSWTEYNGDEIVTDLNEGDHVRIIDGKPHYEGGGRGANVKIHACQWTVLHRVERGDGPRVSKFQPKEREITASEFSGAEDLEQSAFKPTEAYHHQESTLNQRRAKPANTPESATNFERRETADPLGTRVFSSGSSTALCS